MAVQGGGPAPGGFDYNQWAAMNLRGGGSAEAPPDTMDDITKKSADKLMQTIFTKFLGIMNTDIEGRGVVPGETNVGTGFALNAGGGGLLGLFRDTGGILSSILKYFTRDLPAGLMETLGLSGDGSTGSASSGDSGNSGGGADTGGGNATSSDMGTGFAGSGQGGGGDFPSLGGGGQDFGGDTMVNYGGKMIVADVPMQDIGQLRAQATPAGDDRMISSNRGGDLSV